MELAPMAAENFVEEFCEETTCTICLECFKDPVTIDCGHNFCQACLSQYWEESDKEASCPQCRELVQQKQFKPNRQLANVANLVKKLQRLKNGEEEGDMCDKHQGLLKFFCMDDITPVCVVCCKFTHRSHKVVPIEEAVQDYKEKFKALLELLKKEKGKLKTLKSFEDLSRHEFRKKFELEHLRARSAFDKMHKFLEECQSLWMVHLEEMVKEMEKRTEKNMTNISNGFSRVSQLTTEIEEICEQPANKFLQNIRNALDRYKKDIEEYTQDLSPSLDEKFRYSCLKNSVLERAIENYKEFVETALNPSILQPSVHPDRLKEFANKVCVTFDPDTAHPYLRLSEDLMTVSWETRKKKREHLKKTLPNNPERYSWETCVLGSQRFTTGIHWWAVEIGGMGSWAIGVAKESTKKKGVLQMNPVEGVWSLRKPFHSASYLACELVAVIMPEPIVLMLKQQPTQILVVLDYEDGRVEFFDGDTNGFIFAFNTGSFGGETIRPFFDLRETGFCLKCLP
ncbi:zinc finger protein RFP-like isoform X2 [Sceloporus undulatus]|uniref:zinc finger protein RFP-like isoform X2 n=1 Tax=Sceloporus undulatus TaxID=8520 RepID=UPI001C4A9C13|nr:zinc finger protein RFP-like isoform X2 [Sceloporus undulatus]